MTERLRNLIEKLQVLSDRGEAGEAQVAKEKLEIILGKYGVNIEDLSHHNLKQDRVFSYKDQWDQKILIQIATYYLGRAGARDAIVGADNDNKTITLSITDEIFIDLSQTLEECRKDFEEELEVMFIAFIQRHKLGISDEISSKREMDPETLGKVRAMMGGLSTEGTPSKSSGKQEEKTAEIQWDPKRIE